ncbi:hypothetical protein [Kribbella speibonae]|uniref:DNA topoisomerase I catalytic core eukaryotic-type domain-containing protein n=1 Tax=Kribbella speibonae TaxID=1572660 RepID=A0A4R0IDL1_9ACTN|nr:hypothetical protein [Kribbella speibonae]TCC28878.1 hypothetical protein E0H92_42575 [Kribbella speibonae]
MLRDDVRVSHGKLVFDFRAKGGRHKLPQLLVYRDGDDYHEIDAAMINERFRELVGEDFTVKDLRTWTATVHAAVDLAEAEPPTTKQSLNAAVKEMLDEVSDHLGNTPAVARASYVDPRVVEQYEHGHTIAGTVDRVGDDLADEKTRASLERSVNKVLDQGARE